MSAAIIYTVLSVIFTALSTVLQKVALTEKFCPNILGSYVCLGAAFILLPFCDLSIIRNAGIFPLLICFLHGLLYFVIGRLDMMALEKMNADSCSLFNNLTLVFALLYGTIILGDTVGMLHVFGALFIVASSYLSSKTTSAPQQSYVYVLKLLVAIFIFADSAIEKILTTHLGAAEISMIGLLICGSIFLCHVPFGNKVQPKIQRTSDLKIALIPICCAASVYFWVSALAIGSYTVVSCLIQTTVVATFIIELLLRGKNPEVKTQVKQRAVTSLACCIGAIVLVIA